MLDRPLDRIMRAALLWSLLGSCGLVCAADDEVPDMEFLEYLGLWEESDEIWMLMDEHMVAEAEQQIELAPEGQESVEKDDES